MTIRRNLGVLGGMGPAATAEFLRLLAAESPATSDQEHPRVLLISEPGIPDRSAAVLAGRLDPLIPIRAALLDLVRWGADLLAVPCNTAHAFIDRIGDELPLPLVHIVDATLREAVRRAPGGGWLAATTGTVASGLYQHRARRLGYPLHVPGAAAQASIQQTSVLVKAGRTAEAGQVFAAATRGLWRQHRVPVLAACTELPIAYEAAGLPADAMVSSLQALALACLDRLHGESDTPTLIRPGVMPG
ncbi:aspartate/glutamate racemase family protein [Micromonospora sp. NPDC006431]|uniref:aspartate/glutamate racemase family protein n=1 Tax=unclassified Micromonospora TaxID=2617518 RepID=UPI0036C26A9A